jgi:uncharacterized Zn finger protein
MYFGWQPYVSVAERKRQAEKKLAQMKKQGQPVAPVTIEGRKITASFWGKSWCENLERYSDYESRLPRGRSYVRNGSVVDLQIAGGEVTALVSGSSLYRIRITIARVKPEAWKSICRDCAGSVSSLVELLQGRIAKNVMDRVCRQGDGLFPSPRDIKLSCSCPDWASMCKHVAAALYGVGSRLDQRPELLFVLRGVDQSDLLCAGPQMTLSAPAAAGRVLDGGDVAALFGLEMADGAGTAAPAAGPPPRPAAKKASAADSRSSKGAAGRSAKMAARPAPAKGKTSVAIAGVAKKNGRRNGPTKPLRERAARAKRRSGVIHPSL